MNGSALTQARLRAALSAAGLTDLAPVGSEGWMVAVPLQDGQSALVYALALPQAHTVRLAVPLLIEPPLTDRAVVHLNDDGDLPLQLTKGGRPARFSARLDVVLGHGDPDGLRRSVATLLEATAQLCEDLAREQRVSAKVPTLDPRQAARPATH